MEHSNNMLLWIEKGNCGAICNWDKEWHMRHICHQTICCCVVDPFL
jgi:hypothetical protein